MQHQHYDLKYLEAGRVVEVALEGLANVRLMDHASYQEYKADRRYSFVGGLVSSPTYRLTIPADGHWHVVLDLGGQPGRLKSGVRVLQKQPEFVKKSTLVAAPSLYLGRKGEPRESDVFIVHVPEDKPLVRSFAFALRKKGLKVSYDDFELLPEDNLYQKVNAGMDSCNLGIAVVSRSFVKQGWIEGGVARMSVKSFSGKQVLLPLWHDILRDEALEFCSGIACLESHNTAVNTLDEIAEDVAVFVQALGSAGKKEAAFF